MSFRIAAGDDRVVTIPLAWNNAPYFPPVGSHLIFTAKRFYSDGDIDAVFQKASSAGITVSGSNAYVSILRTDTLSLNPGPYFYDVQVRQPDYNVYTLVSSSFTITPDITVSGEPTVPIYTTEPTPYQIIVDSVGIATDAADTATAQANIAIAQADIASTAADTATAQAAIAVDAAAALDAALVTLDGKVSKSGDTMTGALVLPADPISDLEAATKSYVDLNSVGISVKGSVQAATYANISLSGTQTIDGVSLLVGDRVLVKDQSNPVQNGIFIVALSTWTRAADADTWSKLRNSFVFVTGGNINIGNSYVCIIPAAGTVGIDPIEFDLFTTGGASYTSGDGITITGPTIAVTTRLKALNDFTGTGYAYRLLNGSWVSAETIPAAAITGLAAVATSGSFTDLINIATYDVITNSNGTSTSTKPSVSIDHRIKMTITGGVGTRILEFYSTSWATNTVIEIRYLFPPVAGITVITRDNTGNVMDTIVTDASGDEALVALQYDSDGMKLISSLYPAF